MALLRKVSRCSSVLDTRRSVLCNRPVLPPAPARVARHNVWADFSGSRSGARWRRVRGVAAHRASPSPPHATATPGLSTRSYQSSIPPSQPSPPTPRSPRSPHDSVIGDDAEQSRHAGSQERRSAGARRGPRKNRCLGSGCRPARYSDKSVGRGRRAWKARG